MLNRIDPKAVNAMVEASIAPVEVSETPDSAVSARDADYITIDDFAKD